MLLSVTVGLALQAFPATGLAMPDDPRQTPPERQAFLHFVEDLGASASAKTIIVDGKAFLARFPTSDQRRFVHRAVQVRTNLMAPLTDPKFDVRGESAALVNEWVEELQEINSTTFIEEGMDVYLLDGYPCVEHLVSAGFSAVPNLIQALADPRLTDPGYTEWVKGNPQRVTLMRDDAMHILGRISGGEIAFPDLFKLGSQNVPKAQQAARLWWSKAKRIGEISWLTKRVLNGQSNVDDLAARLINLEGRRAIPTILASYPRISEGNMRSAVLRVIGPIRNASVRHLIRKEAFCGLDADTRLVASEYLAKTDRSAAVAAMLKELDRPQLAQIPTNKVPDDFLVKWGHRVGLRALSPHISSFSAERCFDLLFNFPSEDDVWRGWPNPSPADQVQVRHEEERFFASELLDERRLTNAAGAIENHRLTDPRPCDLASYQLATRIGAPYVFDGARDVTWAEAARLHNYRVWLHRRGRRTTGSVPVKNVIGGENQPRTALLP